MIKDAILNAQIRGYRVALLVSSRSRDSRIQLLVLGCVFVLVLADKNAIHECGLKRHRLSHLICSSISQRRVQYPRLMYNFAVYGT